MSGMTEGLQASITSLRLALIRHQSYNLSNAHHVAVLAEDLERVLYTVEKQHEALLDINNSLSGLPGTIERLQRLTRATL